MDAATANVRTVSAHRLRIICVNDIYSFDDFDANGPSRGGWSRASTLIKTLKQKCTIDASSSNAPSGTVLVTVNGDVLGGSSLLQHTKGEVAVEVMNSVPVDIAVLGNHEFDYGDEVLMDRIKESDCTWLGSNVYYMNKNNEKSYFPGVEGDGVIHTLNGDLKVGVFGLCTKETSKISVRLADTLQYLVFDDIPLIHSSFLKYPSHKVSFDDDILVVSRKICNNLRSRGAQVVVAITHMSETEDLKLANDEESGVDLIVGGHEHEPFSNMVHRGENESQKDVFDLYQKHNQGGVLVFKCGMNAYWVGTVDLDIEYERSLVSNSQSNQEQTRVTSISTSWAMHSISSQTPENPQVSEIVRRHRSDTEQKMLVASFGEDIAPQLNLDSVLATIETSNNLMHAILPLDTRMSSVRKREATGGNFVADAMQSMLAKNIQPVYFALPMLAMINGGFIRADRLYQPGSDFTVRHLLKELPFPVGMVVLKLEGKHLKDALAQQLKGSSRGPTGKLNPSVTTTISHIHPSLFAVL